MDRKHGFAVCACALALAVSCGSGGSSSDKGSSAGQAAAPAPKPEARLQQLLAAHEQEWAACVKTSAEQGATLDKMRQALIAGDRKKIDALERQSEAASAAIRKCLETKASIAKELQATGAPAAAVDEAWKAFHTRLGGQQEAGPSH